MDKTAAHIDPYVAVEVSRIVVGGPVAGDSRAGWIYRAVDLVDTAGPASRRARRGRRGER